MTQQKPVIEPLLTPGEVAAAFGVYVQTVARWARSGRLRSVRTLGGQRRFRLSDVNALLEADGRWITAHREWSTPSAIGEQPGEDGVSA